jgi:small basic protein (TIGR04137 family)
MSIHSSLKAAGAGKGQRNVWTRMERIQVLKKAGRWQQADGVEGLPKVRTSFKLKSKKKKDDEETKTP